MSAHCVARRLKIEINIVRVVLSARHEIFQKPWAISHNNKACKKLKIIIRIKKNSRVSSRSEIHSCVWNVANQVGRYPTTDESQRLCMRKMKINRWSHLCDCVVTIFCTSFKYDGDTHRNWLWIDRIQVQVRFKTDADWKWAPRKKCRWISWFVGKYYN